MNILVCGFMGSGKTTFIESFKDNDLGFMTFDLDQVVCEELGITHQELGEWIKNHGMAEFRQKEISALQSLLNMRTMKIIALGGGTIEAAGFDELRTQAKMIFLNTPFETCYKRIKNDSNRPMTLLGEDGLRNLYQKRLPLYQQAELILSETQIKEIEGLVPLVHNLKSI